ncbi:hypothetical protein Sp245p_31375 (plasmid) [Azospirillum baldaniorum]|nr:hypothetical protein Sp245p_31375 [Azospirillum baldaniorum]
MAGVGRRAVPALLLGVGATALFAKPAQAVCCPPTVYDPMVDASVQGVNATLKGVIDKLAEIRALQSQMLDGQGRGSSVADLAPEVQSMLKSVLGGAGAVSLGALGGTARTASSTSMPLNLQRGLTAFQGEPSTVFKTPADGAVRSRQCFAPPAGSDLAGIERVQRRRVAEGRNAAFDGLGTAYHGIASSQAGNERLAQLSDGMNNAASERAQNAAIGAALIGLLEESQTTNRLLAALLRIHAAEALRREDIGPGYKPLLEDA